MRDYVHVFNAVIFKNGWPQPYYTYTIYGSKMEAQTLGAVNLQSLQDSQPPASDWTMAIYEQWLNISTKAKQISLVNNASFAYSPFSDPMFLNENPRATGLNSQAEKKNKPGSKIDYSGAQGLLDLLASLPALAEKLTKAGDLRGASLVNYAYGQVLHLNWTITEAIDYLVFNGVIA